MKKIRIDLTGKRFGRLYVISYSYTDEYKKAKWNCQCDCGNVVIVRSNDLRRGSIQSCGCLANELSSKRRKRPSGDSAKNQLWWGYKRHAQGRNFEFELSREDFWKLTSGNCYYCGIEPRQITKFKDANGQYTYNGVDRVDNSKGYTLDNCVPCCETCNRAKRMMTMEDFLIWINRVYHHQNRFDYLSTIDEEYQILGEGTLPIALEFAEGLSGYNH